MAMGAWTRFAGRAVLAAMIATLVPQALAATPAERLRAAILQAADEGATDPVYTVIERLRVTDGTTTLTLALDPERSDAPASFAAMTRPDAIPAADWKALVEMPLDADAIWSESALLHFTLLDIDGDGRLDLLREQYVGGTGLFSYISLIRQDPVEGFARIDEDSIIDGAPSALATYAISGRGGDQALDLLRLDDRVVAVYRDSTYGVDTLTVDTPFAASMSSQALKVRYVMAHTALATQDPPSDVNIDEGLLKAVNRQLEIHARQRPGPDKQACPSSVDDDNPWPWGASHYSFEYAWSFPVRHRQQCLSAAVVNFLGSGRGHAGDLHPCCAVWLFDQNGERVAEYWLETRRRMIAVDLVASSTEG